MNQYDLIVIGAGPGGEVGAIRASQLGLKTALVEKNVHLGGTCLNVGCIPTKALLHSAAVYDKLKHAEEDGFTVGKFSFDWAKIMTRKEKIVDQQRKGLLYLMKKNKVDVYHGTGKFKSATEIDVQGADGKNQTLKSKFVLLATGSKVREISGMASNRKNILTSDSILFIDHVPESLAVIGGGVVGVEFASLFARFGSKVTVIEMAPQILPSEDEETVSELVKNLKKQNIEFETNTKVKSLEDKKDHVLLTTEGGQPRKFSKVLMSIGREPVTDLLDCDKVGIKTEKGFVKVDSHYKTNVQNIFAIGDIIATPALAHTASAEAIHAVEVMAGHHPQVIDYLNNPNAVYTYPEIASVGYTEKKLKELHMDYKSIKFPFSPLAKAKIEGMTEGFIKILYGTKYRELLGVHIVHGKATEMIAEFVLGKVLETTIDEIGIAIHPHPTLSETIMETAHAALGGAIHL